jgi:tRNA pseudouridine65 synthase
MESPLEILFCDAELCVINKPSSHVVHRTRGAGGSPLILQALRDQLAKRIYPVHRLDRGTSGCLAFAFSSETAAKLQQALADGEKRYTALCLGHLPSEGSFDRELTGENGKKQPAHTKYRILKEFAHCSLLDLRILTGRKHQIRRHLSGEGHHIIGDVNHGKGWLNRRFREDFGFHRLFLHCHALSFLHPRTGEKIQLNCPLPDELHALLESLN